MTLLLHTGTLSTHSPLAIYTWAFSLEPWGIIGSPFSFKGNLISQFPNESEVRECSCLFHSLKSPVKLIYFAPGAHSL